MPIESLEGATKKGVTAVQNYALLSGRAIGNLFARPRYLGDLITQADSIGIGSLPIVILTGFFTGGVLALQTASSLSQFGATAITGQLVSLAMIKELGPVLTSLMVSGRNASGMASELGSMMVTEQIDAMRALGTDPLKKLVTPRVIATIFMLFFLTIISDAVGTGGGAFVSVFMLSQDGSQYFHSAYQALQFADVIQGLVKPVVFGFIIATIGCYYGVNTRGGTQGVGRSTTQAVVVSSVLIIAVDFVISRFMIGVLAGDLPRPLTVQRLINNLQSATMATTPQAEAERAVESPSEPVLVFENVSIGFEGKKVLQDVSFSVAAGSTRILLGPAGGGKSVLLKLANGLLKPDSGGITVFGERISDMPEEDLFKLRGRIGMVFQEGALFDSLTVRDNVAYRLTEQHVPEAEVTARVTEALRFVELEQTLDKYPSELSGGMRRRVAIARAIVSHPDLILYDSPTGGLDPITSTTIIELVMKQRDVYGTTSLVVTHRLQDAFTLATRIFDRKENHMVLIPGGQLDPRTSFLVLNDGRLIFDGSTQELVSSDDPFLKEFLSVL